MGPFGTVGGGASASEYRPSGYDRHGGRRVCLAESGYRQAARFGNDLWWVAVGFDDRFLIMEAILLVALIGLFATYIVPKILIKLDIVKKRSYYIDMFRDVI